MHHHDRRDSAGVVDLRQMRIGQPFVGHAAGLQGMHLRQADLHRIETKDIGRQGVEPPLLPGAHVVAGRSRQPGAERYNGFFC